VEGAHRRCGVCAGGGFDSGIMDGKFQRRCRQLVNREGEECRVTLGEWKRARGKPDGSGNRYLLCHHGGMGIVGRGRAGGRRCAPTHGRAAQPRPRRGEGGQAAHGQWLCGQGREVRDLSVGRVYSVSGG
jgi:hypothetical protein